MRKSGNRKSRHPRVGAGVADPGFRLRLYHDPGFAAPIGDHVMPMRKFALVAEELRRKPGFEICSPPAISESDLLRVHTPEYVSAVKTGLPRDLAESQKFPWSRALFASVLLTSGGVLAAARSALGEGVSGALASGFHHAFADHGEGFCTFNGLIIALEALRNEGRIQSAAILDLDLHYGNGTASLVASRPWIKALSIYGNDYANNTPYRDVSVRRHIDGKNHISAPISPSVNDGEQLQNLLDQYLPWLLDGSRPDLLLFQAGADPLRDDPYSPLDLNHRDLFLRDRKVFAFAKDNALPAAWVLAGGYAPDLQKVVDAHLNTAMASLKTYSFS
ncbi:MAG TPA: histone deacetylase [Terrimicrobiaceae bacterium]